MTRPTLRPHEVAQRLGISTATVRRRIRSGQYKHVRDGRCVLVFVDSLPDMREPEPAGDPDLEEIWNRFR